MMWAVHQAVSKTRMAVISLQIEKDRKLPYLCVYDILPILPYLRVFDILPILPYLRVSCITNLQMYPLYSHMAIQASLLLLVVNLLT
jgi:hypothetical protein